MKRAGLLVAGGIVVAASGLMGGCEHKDATMLYDSKIDTLLPTYYQATPDTGILDDQRTVFAKMRDANASAHPVAPAAAPATAPATAPDAAAPPAPPA